MKNKYIVFVAMGIELIGITVSCLLIGQQLDKHFGLKGLAMIGLSMFGLAGWLAHIIFLAKKMDSSSGE